MDPRHARHERSHILYDAARFPEPGPELFEPGLAEPSDQAPGGPAGGRGGARFLRVAGIPAVLRPYRRGGYLAPLLCDRYLRRRVQASRPWREWWLLARLHQEGFPVPAPLAARFRAQGIFYRAEIIIERLEARTLAQALCQGRISVGQWQAIGSCIGRLHRRGLDHADLNAHNIMLGEDGAVAVIDLDRARMRAPGPWCRRNLARLQRSLNKLAIHEPSFTAVEPHELAALHRGWQSQLEATSAHEP